MTNYNAEDFKGFYDEINNEKRAEDREDKVLDMAWQLYCAYESNMKLITVGECLDKVKRFIKIYEEQK